MSLKTQKGEKGDKREAQKGGKKNDPKVLASVVLALAEGGKKENIYIYTHTQTILCLRNTIKGLPWWPNG